MYSNKYMYLMTCLVLFFIIGCSGGKTPVTLDNSPESLDTVPIIGLTDSSDVFSATGLLGAFELNINPDDMTAELIAKRTSSLGESFIVSGLGFFTVAPCTDCLKLVGLNFSGGNFVLTFWIDHPFPPGNPLGEPTATNRNDLNVFDLAMIVVPDATPVTYSAIEASIYTNTLAEPDGYTTELANVLTDNAAMPYVLVVEESDEASHTWNVFPMGGSETFDVAFKLTLDDGPLHFGTFLTMGYGVSAKKPKRLTPKYYNPEFNRKAAWKVEAQALGTWTDSDCVTTVDVEIKIYDWQDIATVYADPDNFEDAPEDNIYASSTVDYVFVEIPGMNATPGNALKTGGTGLPTDPLIYNIPVANANLIAAGTYTGLVEVMDERPCLSVVDGRDIIIDAPDGVTLTHYTMPEYVTYQTFTAIVIPDCTGYCWTKTWGGASAAVSDSVSLDQEGNTYVTGRFEGTVYFNPDGGGAQLAYGRMDAFLSKFDSAGNWQWSKIWGGSDDDWGQSVAVDQSGNAYVTGYIDGNWTIYDTFLRKFDSSGNLLWMKTWGGPSGDGRSVSVDQAGNAYVTGSFRETVDFNPDGGGSQTSNGVTDVYLSKFDSSGNWQWTKTWGGMAFDDFDYGNSVSLDQAGNTYVTGTFEGIVDFNPDGGGTQSSNSGADVFLSKFDSAGLWQWTKIWGGSWNDEGNSVALDQTGNVYITGGFGDIVDFNPDGGGTQSSNGDNDVFLSKFDSAGLWQGTKIGGGSWNDEGNSVALDQTGNVYITGGFGDIVDFNPVGGGTQSSNGDNDVFLSKFDSAGNWMWSKTWGGTYDDRGHSVALDQADYVYVTGGFNNTVDFNPDGGDPQSSNGRSDAFLWKGNY